MRNAPLIAVVLSALLWVLPAAPTGKGGSRSSSGSSRSHSSSSSSGKTVHVKPYTRKDGTVVRAHERSAPGTASHQKSTATSGRSAAAVQRDSNGRIARSSTAKQEFERTHPCPATGKTSGPCRGYVVDHVVPLKRGGPDTPSNMQWQTEAEAKAKDRIE